jgi:hypothetical protein
MAGQFNNVGLRREPGCLMGKNSAPSLLPSWYWYTASNSYTARLIGATIATRCIEITSFGYEQNYNNQYRELALPA